MIGFAPYLAKFTLFLRFRCIAILSMFIRGSVRRQPHFIPCLLPFAAELGNLRVGRKISWKLPPPPPLRRSVMRNTLPRRRRRRRHRRHCRRSPPRLRSNYELAPRSMGWMMMPPLRPQMLEVASKFTWLRFEDLKGFRDTWGKFPGQASKICRDTNTSSAKNAVAFVTPPSLPLFLSPRI